MSFGDQLQHSEYIEVDFQPSRPKRKARAPIPRPLTTSSDLNPAHRRQPSRDPKSIEVELSATFCKIAIIRKVHRQNKIFIIDKRKNEIRKSYIIAANAIKGFIIDHEREVPSQVCRSQFASVHQS